MQSLKFLLRSCEVSRELLKPLALSKCQLALNFPQKNDFHVSSQLMEVPKCRKWLSYNKTVWPPQSPDEERRPAYVCHVKPDIHYSPKKMWYVACLVRGMSVDEAVKQLSFLQQKGAAAVKETILEAQKLAVEKHNVEFKSNLWVAESFATKGKVIKGLRRHARMRSGEIRYTFCHYYVQLEEGKPPKNYYINSKAELNQQEMLDLWLKQMRSRKITSSL
ncbi:39S ribosomal protein L22, mitochondrial [Ischnura elegans]|uniref:39S ribosomal protein L22, mitochondrial n=1 Tax=Ischnura elegans TaxID=197161 RepID=UPI001ED88683|nr:39S ribosomal protein L22, mitochondrial [Ischnura elegans]